ncbi:MAG: 16S rRNA (uracil(1498)-N(3))-methyltransferase [Agarilytica sp.]
MRIPRIYTPQTLASNSTVELEAEASHHLLKVLRMDVGRPLILFNGNGNQYSGAISRATKKTAIVLIQQEEYKPNVSPLNIELAIGLSKGDRFDWVLQKATELGVTQISPLITARSEVKLSSERLEKKMAGWKKVIIGACEQCQRNVLPELKDVQPIQSYIEHSQSSVKLVLHHRSDDALHSLKPEQSAALLIGPEGGLSDTEIQAAETLGFMPLKLGNRVLRTETAPIAALSIMQYLWGDMGA